jgi:hypothetical protein
MVHQKQVNFFLFKKTAAHPDELRFLLLPLMSFKKKIMHTHVSKINLFLKIYIIISIIITCSSSLINVSLREAFSESL